MPNWFINTRSRRKEELISIGKNGVVRFNTAFAEKHLSKKPEYVIVSNPEKVNGDTRVYFAFGNIELFKKYGLEPFSVDWTSQSHRCTVSIANWFKENSFDPKKLVSNYYPQAQKDDKFGKMFYIIL